MDEQKPNEPTASLPLVKPKGKLAGCLSIFFLLSLGTIGLILLIHVIVANSPYKVHCEASGKTYTGGFTDEASANSDYREKTAEGMSCTKEYQ